MGYTPHNRGTLLIPSGTYSDPGKKHLFVLVKVECGGGNCLIVPICSVKEGIHYDPACVVTAGEHEFISHKSYIEYSLAQLKPAVTIEKCVAASMFIEKSDVSELLFDRICSGFISSKFVSKWARAEMASTRKK